MCLTFLDWSIARNPKNTQQKCRKSPNWLEHTDFHDMITDTHIGCFLKFQTSQKGEQKCSGIAMTHTLLSRYYA